MNCWYHYLDDVTWVTHKIKVVWHLLTTLDSTQRIDKFNHMNETTFNFPIITSLLDCDFYKMSMGAVVFQNFPNTIVTYEFFNRGQTVFPKGFAAELRNQIEFLCQLEYTDDEIDYIKGLGYFRANYIEWLKTFKLSADEVKITHTSGDLKIFIKGNWYRTIFWEVKLMAIISELYFRLLGTELADDWQERIVEKAINLEEGECKWSDFGTRRRRSFAIQNQVVSTMKAYKGFMGTSNIYLAKKHGVRVIGTSAHEAVMAMAVHVGYEAANTAWLGYWSDYYNGELGIALPDTFTTDVFLRNFDGKMARLWDGIRQDSGNPEIFADKFKSHYKSLNIPTRDKRLIFSDNLNVQKALSLNAKYKGDFTVIFGIGTNFTNDAFSENQKIMGFKPLNMVIKITSADFGRGFVPTVKLSDDAGKHTGNNELIAQIKHQLNLQ